MIASKKNLYAEVCLLVLGGFYLCYHGAAALFHMIESVSSMPLDSVNADLMLVEGALSAGFPLVIGLGLLILAYSRIVNSELRKV
jgi:hypothetical protein